jgi:hypothetical protein
MSKLRLALFTLTVVTACASPEPGEPGEPGASSAIDRDAFPLSTTNGTNLNGTNLNGTNLNGTNLNGPHAGTLGAVRVDGVVIDGKTLDRVWLEDSELVGGSEGREYDREDFVGANLVGERGDGSAVALRIAGLSGNDGVWRYQVEFQDAQAGWLPICAEGREAIAVSGRWDLRAGVPGGGAKSADPSVFTFGCVDAAIGKCVVMGYHPWEGPSRDALHQACVRLIRADYCGDGQSHTSDGRLINLYDGEGIQADTESWLIEAEWDAHGARCLSSLNRSLVPTVCTEVLLDLACGAKYRFDHGTLLMSETPAGPLY